MSSGELNSRPPLEGGRSSATSYAPSVVSLHAVNRNGAEAQGDSADFGLRHEIGNTIGVLSRVPKSKALVGELPEIVGVQLKIPAERLLHAQVVLVAAARFGSGASRGRRRGWWRVRRRRWNWRGSGSRCKGLPAYASRRRWSTVPVAFSR